MKKAQGISMNVIIIAAIALLVLVVLSIIFLGKMGDWGGQVKNCNTMQGTCQSVDDGCTSLGEGWVQYPSWKCSETQVCCIKSQ